MLPRVELEEDCVADEGDVGLDAGGRAGSGAERDHGTDVRAEVAARDREERLEVVLQLRNRIPELAIGVRVTSTL